MNFFKKLVIASLALITFYTNAISDNHDIVKNNTNAEEPLPLNDPFVGDSSISGGVIIITDDNNSTCLLYTSPSPRDRTRSRMPSSA